MELKPQHRENLQRIEDAMTKFSEAINSLKDYYEDEESEENETDRLVLSLVELDDNLDNILAIIRGLLG